MSPSNDLELEDGLKDIGNKLASPPFDLQQLLLLLDKAENLLSRVEQSPPASMFVALRPSMNALISKDLLGHSDIDVKVAIASCLSEITRITAPDAPYDDDIMKEIFGLIVGAFKNLDDMSSRSFHKRISVLETVAKVRSCVLMLDLDCDDLILEMFHHFLKTIRSTHSDTVFSSMEIAMTLVLEEAESISSRLLSCILDCLKTVEKNILPAAKKLAEKVLVNCSLKLKPYLDELFNGGALLSDYSKIVAAVFQGNLDTSMQNETNVSGENQADNHKLSERTLSDYPLQGSAQQEGENFHPENAVAAADKSSKSLMSNGSFQIGNGTAKPDVRSNLSSHKGGKNALLKLSIINDHYGVGNRKKARVNSGRRKGSSKEAEIISQADGPSKEVESAVCSKIEKKNELELTSDSPDVVASVSLHSPNEHDGTRPRRGRLSQSSGKRNDVDKAAADGLYSAGHKEVLFTSQSKSMELPTRDLILKESEGLGDSKIKQPTGSTKKSRSGSAKHGKGNAKDVTPTTATSDSDTKLLSNRSRNGSQRKVRVNFSEKKQSAETKQQKGHKEVLFTSQSKSMELPIRDLILKESEGLGDSKIKQPTGSTKKSRSGSSKDGKGNAKDVKSTPTTATSDSDTKLLSNRSRNGSQRKIRVNFSEKKQSAETKQQKGVKHPEADNKELKLKELLFSQKSRVKELVKDHNHVKDTGKTKSRKLARGTQETFGPRKRRKGLDDTIVGSKIKIWWPDDQMFYVGVVDSFDRSTKMHKILYNDGDVEVLLLKKEQWEFIEGETDIDGEKDKPDRSASEMSKKSKGSTGATTTDKSSDLPLKSFPDSHGVSDHHLPNHRTRRIVKNKIHNGEVKSSSSTREKSRNRHSEENHKDNNRTEKKSSNKLENESTPKISRKLKNGPSKIRGSVVKDTPTTTKKKKKKNLDKSNGDSSKSTTTTRKFKNNNHKSMKESGVSIDSLTKSLEGSLKAKSKHGRMQGKKGKGGVKPRSISNLKAKRTDAATSGKKRKRATRNGK